MENPDVGRKMFVFIGEKLKVERLPQEAGSIDLKFSARYKILERICGDYDIDTIDFIVYDHYGYPGFAEYKHAMLFVSEINREFYHEKYQFYDVYKTKDGRWASSYKANDYLNFSSQKTTITPVKIDFVEEVSYSTKELRKKEIKRLYPQPYYTISGDKAIAVWGNYIPELFQLKKESLFEKDSVIPKKKVILTRMVNFKISKEESIELKKVWTQFYGAIKNKNTETLKALSLDSVECSICEGLPNDHFYNDPEVIDSFIRSAYEILPDSKLEKVMKTNKFKMEGIKHRRISNSLVKTGDSLFFYNIIFETTAKSNKKLLGQDHKFQFVKVDGKYIFYGVVSRKTFTNYY